MHSGSEPLPLVTAFRSCLCLLVAGLLAAPAVRGDDDASGTQQAARALLRQRCDSCHGAEKQESGLRLDVRDRALLGGDSGKAIVPRKPGDSPLLARVSAEDPDLRMPPEGEGTPLTADEVAVLRKWIEAGAPWPADADEAARSRHWSYQPIERPTPPPAGSLSQPNWVRNAIDAFVLAKLDERGIAPAPEADRPTLMRRVYLDLLGLPPTPEQLRQFLQDQAPGAYERMAQRALESPHYGERWGRHWLDLARYADSDGYEKDRPRPNAWRYREWVIDALNNDMPFDQFTVEQIAGDMLPDADVSQQIATGFHRNTLHNTEGGVDREEDRVKKTVDRINTIGSIWLGTTVGCAQCHSHKYDPLSQREYYQLYALVNSMDERDVPAPTPAEQRELAEAKRRHQQQAEKLKAARDAYLRDKLPAAQRQWEAMAAEQAGWSDVQLTEMKSKHGAKFEPQEDGSLLVSGENKQSDAYTLKFDAPTDVAAVRLEVLPDKRLPKSGPGRAENGNFVLTTLRIERLDDGQPLELKAASARADFSQQDWDVALAINDTPTDGWAVSPQIGQRHVAVFALQQPVPAGEQLVVTLDQNYDGGGTHNLGRFRLSVSGDAAAPLDGVPQQVAEALAAAEEDRTPAQRKQIADYYRGVDPQLAKLDQQLADHQAKAPKESGKKARAVAERPSPRQAHIHLRGDFLSPGDPVQPQGPAFLPPIPPPSDGSSSGDAGSEGEVSAGSSPAEPLDRLDLARWLVSEDHPLTARVTVNRIWQRYFGRGIVRTIDDFGSQGAEPTHRLLLDYLASELRGGGWRLKRIHRLIVNSSTYRQSSQVREDLRRIDPQNELLARHSRRRVEAEIVRDLALAVSGLLDPKIGGPSVRPPQPAEYSKLTYANSASWKVSSGGDKYRRGLYTFFQRTSPYPMLMTFDSPDSTACTARRSESNTPLQALTLWNDSVFFECSQHLGRRIVAEQPAAADLEQTIRQRADYALRLCLTRVPGEQELDALAEAHRRHRDLCQQAGEEELTSLLGDAPLPPDAAAAETAAWVLTGRVLLNLDAFITKP